jgi:PAS domain S-box-containing protein
MKTNITKAVFTFALSFIVFIIVSYIFLALFDKEYTSSNHFLFLYIRDAILFLFATLFILFFLNKNKNKNKAMFEKLTQTSHKIFESNERYDIVAKATSDTIWDWNLKDSSIIWNKGIQGVFGYKKEDVGKNSDWWFEKIHPEDSLKMSVKIYSFIEQRTEKWQDEYRFQCADGTYKYVLDRGFLIKNSEGVPIRMIGAIQDITKRKEEEQRLKLLETVITQTKDSVMITSIDITENYIPAILFVNPAFSNMTGYRRDDVIGKSAVFLFGPKSDILKFDELKTSIQEFKECVIESICYKKNGEEFWLNISMIPVTNNDGEYTHWISIQRDITEIKNKEKEREQLIKELTQNNKDLKQFSYITSHNLRAPLSNLTGLLNLLDDIKIEDEEVNEIINGFSKSTHLLNETINDLVKVVIIKDNAQIQKEKILIREIFENVFNQLSYLINHHKPILKIELDDTSILDINKSYLESIFQNLLTNTIKYKDQNRQLRITVSSSIEKEHIVIKVKDNGIGIDLERNKDKIFGLYQRFHNYPDSKGLGLYLVKSQVEAMNGTISVESKVGVGSCFTIKFLIS